MERKQLFNARLDENVIITMLAVSIIAFIIFAFRVKNHEPCTQYAIYASTTYSQTGKLIQFETNAPNAKSLKWNFGDNQEASGIASTVHAYDEPNEYTVTLSSDNKCPSDPITVVISQAKKVTDPQLVVAFRCPDTAEVGKRVFFRDSTKGATQWQWYFGENLKVDDTLQNPSYVYTSTGKKTVSLTINKDPRWSEVRYVFVVPVKIIPPPAPRPPKNGGKNGGGGEGKHPDTLIDDSIKDTIVTPPPIDITEKILEDELRGVADHNPLYTVEYFHKYMGQDFKVTLNGKKNSFEEVYSKFYSLKNAHRIVDLTAIPVVIREGGVMRIGLLNIICKVKINVLGAKVGKKDL